MVNIQKMMQQAQQMQNKIAEMQEKFKDIEVTGESGGGAVKVTMNCAGTVRLLDIDPSLINAEEKDMLEDLIMAAINTANEAKDTKIEEETKKVMGDMGMPPGAKLPF